jgi:predicted metal-dependent phosphoesterase TrpH
MSARRVEIFSITDHDAVGAYEEIAAADLNGAKLVTGIEINSTYKENEVHVLGYGFDREAPALAALIDRNRAARRRRIEAMVERLRAAGYDIDVDAVLAEAADDAALGRPHVAKALVRMGAVPDVASAFKQMLSRRGAGYVPSTHVTPQEAIDAIASAGGVPVLAHPGRLHDTSIVDELAECGLVGLEAFHPSHDARTRSTMLEKAKAFGLVVTAGSDFHDPVHNPEGVGMTVDDAVIRPFLDLVV